MPKPEISIENRDLYPWYVEHESDPRAVWIGTTIMGLARPRVILGEGVQDEILDHRADDGVLAINGSHQSWTDQFHVARLPRKAPEALGDIEGVARIGAKVGLFKNKWLRAGVEQMRAFPAIRRKDVVRQLGRDLDEDEEAMLALNQEEFIQASIAMIEKGQDLFNFPRGTRDSDDASKVKKGMGKIAVGVSDEVNLAILPIGIYFPKFRAVGRRNVVRPTIYVDHLVPGPFHDEEAVTQLLSERIPASVEEAKERTPKRIYRT